jgi:type VI protein secretion system component VasF
VTDSRPKETIAAAIPQTYEELKAALTDAQAKIASLSADASRSLATGLRKRKASAEEAIEKSPTASAVARQVTHEGVPVKIVAALCFLSFLLAYLFF